MPSIEGGGAAIPTKSFRILVVGGSYAGLGAIVNLLDFCAGQVAHTSPPEAEAEHSGRVNAQITLVDERDGYCEYTEALFRSQTMKPWGKGADPEYEFSQFI